MTRHYMDEVTAEDIVAGWRAHGGRLPGAYAICSHGDSLAYSCWEYLRQAELREKYDERPALTIEMFFSKVDEDYRIEVIQMCHDVIALLE